MVRWTSAGHFAALVGLCALLACGRAEKSGATHGSRGGTAGTPTSGSSGTPSTAGADATTTGAGGFTGAAGLAGSGGTPGASGGSVAGTSGAAPGGAGGSAGLDVSEGGEPAMGDDPEPVHGDPEGLVATSSHYLVFTLGPDYGSTELMFLDLEGSGAPVQVNVPDTTLDTRQLSNDGEFLIYSQGTEPIENDLFLNQFTASGYVPGRVVGGFEGRPGLHSACCAGFGFDASSRFVAFARTASTPGLDIVDAARNVRHFSADLPGTLTFDWAPVGYYFTYTLDPDGTTAKKQTFVAKVTSSGASQPLELPPNVIARHFSPDGQRLFYMTKDAESMVALGYLEPLGSQLQFYESKMAADATDFYVEPSGNSVVTQLPAKDSGRQVVQRLFVDAGREPKTLWDPNPDDLMGTIRIIPSQSGALAEIVFQQVVTVYGYQLLSGDDVFELGGDPAFYGDKLVYFDGIDPAILATLTAAGIDVAVVDGSSDPRSACWSPVKSKVALAGSTAMHLMDFDTGQSRDFPVTEPNARLNCPVFSFSGDACAYVELVAAGSNVWVVRFGADGPSEPELALTIPRTVHMQIAHP